MSLRDQILQSSDLKRERVEVPEWAGPDGAPAVVYVSMMTGATRAAWNAVAFGEDGEAIVSHVRPRLLVYCLTDQAGEPVFALDDVAALDGKSDAVLSRLFKQAKRLNAIDADAVDAAEKNSPGAAPLTSS